MKGHPKVIEVLNELLMGELTAINQYFLHSRMCKSWRYERIAKKMWEESIDEMKYASDLADRILLLEGVPNFQRLGKLNIGENVKEQLESDYRMEETAIAGLRSGIGVCLSLEDHASRELLEHILEKEEEHLDWIEAQLKIIQDIGIANYLAQQLYTT